MNRGEKTITGRGEEKRQTERLQQRAERMERWLRENPPKMGRQGRGD